MTFFFSLSRSVRIGDPDHTVNLTFWEKDIDLIDTMKEDDVVSIKNFTLDFYNVAPDQPPNMTYTSLFGTRSELVILANEDVPNYIAGMKNVYLKEL